MRRPRGDRLDAGLTVVVATSAKGPTARKITLVGEAAPHKSTTLYSKVSGYLTRIAVDTGDRVKAGQFIAEIESPELESEYRSAVASLENKQRVLERTSDLAKKGFFSQQALDNARDGVPRSSEVMSMNCAPGWATRRCARRSPAWSLLAMSTRVRW